MSVSTPRREGQITQEPFLSLGTCIYVRDGTPSRLQFTPTQQTISIQTDPGAKRSEKGTSLLIQEKYYFYQVYKLHFVHIKICLNYVAATTAEILGVIKRNHIAILLMEISKVSHAVLEPAEVSESLCMLSAPYII